MSSQANRSANRQEELKAEIRKYKAEYRKFLTLLEQAIGKIGNDDPRISEAALRALYGLIQNSSRMLIREVRLDGQRNKEARELIFKAIRYSKAERERIDRERNKERRVDLQRINKNSKDLKELQNAIKELQAKIGAAETMTILGSESGSGSGSRKRRRRQLKL